MTEEVNYQERVNLWLQECFGSKIANSKTERNYRFLEESLELVQACGLTKSDALKLVDYVFERDIGEKSQECGGVMVTLAALAIANNIDMIECGESELDRIWDKIEEIRQKHINKTIRI